MTTDNEIIMSLECCSSNATGNEYCKDCPYNIYEYCGEESAKDTLNLINRLKAEIERLQGDIKEKTDTIDFLKEQVVNWNNDYCELKMKFKSAKSEAYKEIIAKLKEHLCSYDMPDYHYFRAIDEDTIDEVLNEMVGE